MALATTTQRILTLVALLSHSFLVKPTGAFSIPTGQHCSSVSAHSSRRSQVHSATDDDTSDVSDVSELETSSNAISDDFPTWVKGLRQWPLYPTRQEEEEEAAAAEEFNEDAGQMIFNAEEEPSSSSFPLEDLMNVETLLMSTRISAEQDGNDKDDDIINDELPLSNLFKQTKTTATSLASSPKFDDDLRDWGRLVYRLQKSVGDLTEDATKTSSAAISNATEIIFREATSRLDYLVTEASSAISPLALQDLLQKASRAATSVDAVELLIRSQQGSEAADRARQVAKDTVKLVTVANGLLAAGYARSKNEPRTEGNAGTKTQSTNQGSFIEDDANTDDDGPIWEDSRPLFDEFESAQLVESSSPEYKAVISKGAEMGTLSGAIYQETVPRVHQLGHTIVANGTTAEVSWLVTDSIGYTDEFDEDAKSSNRDPVFVRTITIRGFDASDENVDRERLLNDVCTANPVPLGTKGIHVHNGLWNITNAIYQDIQKHIDQMAPTHKLVINGHSVGGSISVLFLLLLAQERSVDFVRNRILRVYTFGSPPVVTIIDQPGEGAEEESSKRRSKVMNFRANKKSETRGGQDPYACSILTRFDLPSNMVYGYIQPWDPIARLFSNNDPLYPLLGDLGEDGITVYASGPPRTLRPITRAIIESWEGWPRFRDNFRQTVNQNFTSVGVQHIMLPEPIRYLSDRLVSVNVQVPPVDSVLRISPNELLPALVQKFPLDVFRISFVPAAIRSFIHHFYPAYGFPIVDFAEKTQSEVLVPPSLKKSEKQDYERAMKDVEELLEPAILANSQQQMEDGSRTTTTTATTTAAATTTTSSSSTTNGWSPTQWLQFRSN